MRLRTFLTLGAVVSVLLGIGAAGGLVWTTTLLQQASLGLSEAVERAQASAQVEIHLLLLQVAHEAAEAPSEHGQTHRAA